jgi:hypothetical protein
MEGTLYLSKKKKGGSVMDSSIQIKGIKLMQVFEDYDLAIYHCYEMLEVYYLTGNALLIKYWEDVIQYLTESKKQDKTEIAEVVQVRERKFLWLNVWKQNLIDNYFVTTHTREDVADKVMDEELRDIHVVKLKIEL